MDDTTTKRAYTIPEFCAAYGFSRAGYYNLPKEKRPREMKFGRRSKRITFDAADEWQDQMMEQEPVAG